MLDLADLPPQIVAAVEALASRLAVHVREHREASLEVHEQGVLDAWRAEGGRDSGWRRHRRHDGCRPAGATTTQRLSAVQPGLSRAAMAWPQRPYPLGLR